MGKLTNNLQSFAAYLIAGRLFRRENGEAWLQFKTIYGVEGEYREPYMTRLLVGRLRLHIFHRGDNDPDPHDHPWDFWTFPITSYVEEVTEKNWPGAGKAYFTYRQVVPSWRWSRREAGHTHRVLGRWAGRDRALADPVPVPRFLDGSGMKGYRPKKIVTIVWRGHNKRRWGFLKMRDGRWCWQHWEEYIHGGGKHAACE